MDFHTLQARLVGATTAAAIAVGMVGLTASPAAAQDDRRIVRYTVKPGDTATELAVRFHAWTAELIRLNDLGPSATLYAGERLRIPVVVSRAEPAKTKPAKAKPAKDRPTKAKPAKARSGHADPSRATVRRMIIRQANRHGIDPQLALAISWQESGWQMHHTSSAGAIGAMQVMPDTGTWMEWYAGRQLDLRRTRDNIAAGVLLLRVLRAMTSSQRDQIAAYYQGIGAVQRGIMYTDTVRYVSNVKAIKRQLGAGWNPA